MNPKLQAGVELVLEKIAAEQYNSSLAGVLNQKYAEAMESNIVKEEKGKSNGNTKAGKNDQKSEPTIEGGDDISGMTISSDHGNAKTASGQSPLMATMLRCLGKEAADPEESLGTRASDTTQTDNLEPAKSVSKNPTAGGGDPASKANRNPLISGDGGGLNTMTGPKDTDSTKEHSQKIAAWKRAFASRNASPADNAQAQHKGAQSYPKPEGNTDGGEIPREVLPKTASVNQRLMLGTLKKYAAGAGGKLNQQMQSAPLNKALDGITSAAKAKGPGSWRSSINPAQAGRRIGSPVGSAQAMAPWKAPQIGDPRSIAAFPEAQSVPGARPSSGGVISKGMNYLNRGLASVPSAVAKGAQNLGQRYSQAQKAFNTNPTPKPQQAGHQRVSPAVLKEIQEWNKYRSTLKPDPTTPVAQPAKALEQMQRYRPSAMSSLPSNFNPLQDAAKASAGEGQWQRFDPQAAYRKRQQQPHRQQRLQEAYKRRAALKAKQ